MSDAYRGRWQVAEGVYVVEPEPGENWTVLRTRLVMIPHCKVIVSRHRTDDGYVYMVEPVNPDYIDLTPTFGKEVTRVEVSETDWPATQIMLRAQFGEARWPD